MSLLTNSLKPADLSEFQELIVGNAEKYRHCVGDLFHIAHQKGEAFLVCLLRIPTLYRAFQAHTTQWNILMYHCIVKGYTAAAALLRLHFQPSYQALTGALLFQKLVPALRDELRKSVYDRMFRLYAQQSRDPMYHRVGRVGFPQAIRDYHRSILWFWLQVRNRIRHWKVAHTFRPVPAFTPNTDPLAILVQRNPRRVPQAAAEFKRAICNTHEFTAELFRWSSIIPVEKNTIINQALYTKQDAFLADHLEHWPEVAPILSSAVLRPAILRLFGQPDIQLSTLLPCIAAYARAIRNRRDIEALIETDWIAQSIHDPRVAEAIGVHFLWDKSLCLYIWRNPNASYFTQTMTRLPVFQERYSHFCAQARYKLSHFVPRIQFCLRRRRQRRAAAIAAHHQAWETLVWRWRWIHRHPCAVCWESGRTLIPLHGEARHAICRKCKDAVTASGSCPLCRAPLERPRTPSDVSSISYTSDHEDPDYDDDQWYHYD